MAVCPSVCLSVCPSVRLLVCPSVRLSVRLFACRSVRKSVCLSVRLSVFTSVCLSVCLSARLSGCTAVRLSVCLSVHLSVCLCVPISVFAVQKCHASPLEVYFSWTLVVCSFKLSFGLSALHHIEIYFPSCMCQCKYLIPNTLMTNKVSSAIIHKHSKVYWFCMLDFVLACF